MTSSDSANVSKKRRKRKDGKQFAPPSTSASETSIEEKVQQAVPIEPKENTVVMPVRDIRSVVSGVDETIDSEYDDETLGPDEEWEYYDDDEDEDDTKSSLNSGRTQDDSMEQLLADAKRMRASKEVQTTQEEKTMSDTVFEVISTIVTIDFFVVIGLLVWFLVGIFCSSVLGNDAVQIAFNMNFEKVTQPALGVLMIGSVAGGEFTCMCVFF